MALLVFLLLYNISFKGEERLPTGRVAVAILWAWAVLARKGFAGLTTAKAWLLFLPFPYAVIQYLFVGDFGQSSRFLHLALYSYMGAFLVVAVLGELEDVYSAVLLAISAQAVVLIISFFSAGYRSWFDSIASTGSNYAIENPYRAPGFTSNAGAALSVIQSFGVWVGLVLLRGVSPTSPSSKWRAAILVAAVTLSLVSCVFVGRTGLLLSVLYVASLVGWRTAIPFVVSFLGVYWVAFKDSAYAALLPDDFSTDYFNRWVFGVFTGDDRSIAALRDMAVPSLTTETFFGTGLASLLPDGGNPSGHDAGFVQAYYSLGLPMACALYAAYAYVLFMILSWMPSKKRMMFTIVFLLIEAKEPFLFKYAVMFVLLLPYFWQLRNAKVGRTSGKRRP